MAKKADSNDVLNLKEIEATSAAADRQLESGPHGVREPHQSEAFWKMGEDDLDALIFLLAVTRFFFRVKDTSLVR